MEAITVKQHIKNKQFNKFYIFSGPEIQIQNIYINKIAQSAGLTISRIDTVLDIYKKGRSSSLVKANYCFVVRDDMEFMKNDKAWSSIINMLGDNMLILLITQVNKREKFYKHYKDDIVMFDYLDIPVLKKYVQKEIPLSENNAEKLVKLCEQDYSRILLEIDKIKSWREEYIKGTRESIDYNGAFLRLVSSGDIYQQPKDAIFEFVDAVLQRKPRLSFTLLEDCKGVNEASLVMQSVMYTQFKHLLQYQSCTSEDVSKSTGLSGWDIKLVKDKKGIYSTGELVYIMKRLRNIEKDIKIGQMEDSICIDYALVNIL